MERITSIDTVRGFAVLAILLMNIISFGLPSAAYPNPTVAGGADPLNLGVWAASFVLVDGKMRALFAMLFGASLLLVAESARAPGSGPIINARRMIVLLGIGLAHGWLFWVGDILFYYSIIGLLIFPLWKRGPRTLLVLAGALLLVQSALHYTAGRQGEQLRVDAMAPGASASDRAAWSDFRASLAAAPEEVVREITAVRGSWWESFQLRRQQLTFFYTVLFPTVFLLETAAQMLIGMALFRLGWWQASKPTRNYIGFAIIATPIGIAAMALNAQAYTETGFDPVRFFRAEAWRVLVGPLLALGYAAMLIAVVKIGHFPAAISRLSAVGRMALSNYLATTLICTFIFQGWGLGLFGELERWQLYIVVLGVWALLLAWSRPWLATHAYGPAEWVWRSLSRGERVPLRKRLPA